MVAFPFLNLPKPALAVMFNQYKPLDLIKVALCSKKAENEIKTLYKSPPGTRLVVQFYRKTAAIRICFEREEICLFFITDKNRGQFLRKQEIGGVEFPIKKGKFRRMDVYSMDKLGALKTLSLFVTSLFGIPIHELTVGNHALDLVTWILERQEKIEDVNLIQNMSNSDLETILDKLRLSNTLDLGLRPKNDFRYDFGKFRNLNQVVFRHGNWLTVKDLCDLETSKGIEIRRSTFTNQQANEFLKSWISGENRNLKEIQFTMETQNLERMLDGIDMTQKEDDEVFYYTGPYQRIGFQSHLVFKSENGIVATIIHSKQNRKWEVFYMEVWPDYLDNPYPLTME
uniref:F-box domain-containing protein n=1 Tax=Caenorhabditis tropicalis TaxID=1561998 RepID=A0A1I7UPA5_9PELO